MPIVQRGKFEHKGTTIAIAQRELNNTVRKSLTETGEKYHDDLLPLRFTKQGARRLGYRPRSAKYTAKKLRKFGHDNPFVYSGISKQEALRVQRIKAKATSKRTEVRVAIAARAINFLRKYRDEITRLASREVTQLTNFNAQRFELNLAKHTETRTEEF